MPTGTTIERSEEEVGKMADRLEPQEELPWVPLTAEDFQRAAGSQKKGKAAGLRGWHGEDLKALPLRAWQELAILSAAWERALELPREWR
eukprot:4357557-Amphidinium_carterae.1